MNTRWILAALALLPLMLCSCEKRLTGSETPQSIAHVRIAHFAASIPEAQIWLDDEMIASNLDYPSLSQRLDLQAGLHYIRVVQIMEPPLTQLNESFAVSADTFYTLVIADTGGVCRKLLLMDTTTANPAFASVRFVHIADGPRLQLKFHDCAAVWGPVGFGRIITYDTTQCRDDVLAESPDVDSLQISIPDFSLTFGRAYTLFAAGHVDGDTLTGLRIIRAQDWP